MTTVVKPGSWRPVWEDDDIDLAFNPNQPRGEDGRWIISASNIVKRWTEATPGEKKAGEDWYPAAHRTAEILAERYEVPVTEAAALLAAYSPQTPWGRNQVLAAETLREGHGLGGPGGHMFHSIDNPDVEERIGLMATGQTKRVADAILQGGDFDEVTAGRNKNGTLKPKALKIRSFYHLIAEGGQSDPENPHVVIDRHAMSVAFGERVDEATYDKLHPGSAAKYLPFVNAYKDAAKEISRIEGREITAEVVQATTWLTQQRLNAAMVSRVGKTRKSLGHKDAIEWAKYAARYLGLDSISTAQVGYSDLARAYDPTQPRDPHTGRWIDTHGGVYIEDPINYQPLIEDSDNNVFERMLGNAPITFAAPGEEDSADEQFRAQKRAERWYNKTMRNADYTNPDLEAARTWSDYQDPRDYSRINKVLRSGGKSPFTATEHDAPDPVKREALQRTYEDNARRQYDKVHHAVDRMFEHGGVKTRKRMTTYRALRGHNTNWAERLEPGAVFQEDGIVSTTAYRRMAQGWLGLRGTEDRDEYVEEIGDQAVVLEMHLPRGTRVVGGTVEFIETMLPPGTRFKVKSRQRRKTPNAVNPVGWIDTAIEPVTYTHVVVDVLPEEEK